MLVYIEVNLFGSGRKEDGFSGLHGQLVAFVVFQDAFAFHTNKDDEGVELAIVERHVLGKVVYRGGEVGAAHQFYRLVLLGGIGSAVIGLYPIVDGFFRELGVKLAGVAVLVLAVEVIDAVGDVGSLLYFGNEASGSNAMDASGREEEDIARLYGIFGQHIAQGVVLNHGSILVGGDTFLQSRAEVSLSVVIVDDIPHLGLSHGLVPFLCQLIVGVYLYGKVVAGIDELDEQREGVSKTAVIVFSHQIGLVGLEQFGKALAGIGTYGHDGVVARHVGYFPTLAYLRLADAFELLERNNFSASPKGGLQYGVEFDGMHRFVLFNRLDVAKLEEISEFLVRIK